MNGDRLLIRAHGGRVAGAGHVMRCLALAEAWQARGGRVTFVAGHGLGTLEPRMRGTGAELARIDEEPGSGADAAATRGLAAAADAAAIVVDGYVFDEAYLCGLAGVAPLMVIDDEPRCARYPVDLLLNQNLHASAEAYAGRAPGARLLLGSAYALIRRELRQRTPASRPGHARTRLLVSLGGADPENVTRTAIRALGAVGDGALEVRVMVGPLNPRAAELVRAGAAGGHHIEVCVDPPDVPALMRWADLAISAAGSTTWELLHAGVPLILVTLAENQRAIADSLGRAGVALALGWHADVTAEAIGAAVLELAGDPGRRAVMSARGSALVDGRGADRVVQELEGVVAPVKAAR